MSKNLHDHTRQERLRVDNDVMKMKLMLERGAVFEALPGERIMNPEIENKFLRKIMEFESICDKTPYMQVFDKIGRPAGFAKESTIAEAEIESAWKELSAFLISHQITIGVCSPNVKPRDLYRFVTEELFFLSISSASLPGLIHGFIYDEFHPDPFYDNPCTALEGCMEPLLGEGPMNNMFYFREFGLQLNEHYPVDQREFMNLVNHLKAELGGFHNGKATAINCEIENGISAIKGTYSVQAGKERGEKNIQGRWEIELRENNGSGLWEITTLRITGMDF